MSSPSQPQAAGTTTATKPTVVSVNLCVGRTLAQNKLQIPAQSFTVFVGPNNSGKSLVLREIHLFVREGQQQRDRHILDSVEFRKPDDVQQEIDRVRLPSGNLRRLPEGNIYVGRPNDYRQLAETQLKAALSDPQANIAVFCYAYLQYRMLFLDGRTRISLVLEQDAGDLQQTPQNTLQTLFSDDDKRENVRNILHDAFGDHYVIDPTRIGRLRIRMATSAPPSSEVERGIHQASVDFHASATPIEDLSDGVKAFTGIMSEIMAGDPSLILIDEPEAFLHPSLSFKLGKQIALQARGTGKSVFASTHSESFLRGCIQSGAPVNIVRLTYRGGEATARLLEHRDLTKLMRNPILRSSRPIQGLFSEFVIVCEADADRAFYEEINERLALVSDDRTIPNCLFINAHNKETIPIILGPLREMGIPAAGVVDLDVLKERTDWSKYLKAAGIPGIQHQGLGNQRHQIVEQLNIADSDWKRNGGIYVLNGANLDAAKNTLETLSAYGIFIVPGGEVETWLGHLCATGKGPGWLEKVFEKMGEDPKDARYLNPSVGDVWDFIGGIKAWMFAAKKKGIPD